MAKQLRPEDRELRKLVVELDGELAAVAEVLGVTPSALSHRLHTERHGAWWRAFKKARSARRKAATQRRWRESQKARLLR